MAELSGRQASCYIILPVSPIFWHMWYMWQTWGTKYIYSNHNIATYASLLALSLSCNIEVHNIEIWDNEIWDKQKIIKHVKFKTWYYQCTFLLHICHIDPSINKVNTTGINYMDLLKVNSTAKFRNIVLPVICGSLLALRGFGKFLLDPTSLLWAVSVVVIMILGHNKWHMKGYNWLIYKPIYPRAIAPQRQYFKLLLLS